MAVAKEQILQIISENNISSVVDVYALLKESFKDILQELMEAELDATLGYEKNQKGDLQTSNKRNGHSSKNLKSQYGEFQVDIPRDHNGEFEPKLIPKYQRDISGIEEKVLSLYARAMSTRDIHDQRQDLYGMEWNGIELSAEMVSKITDKILPEVTEWLSRPLNPVYPFVFMDCIHYKVREDGRVLSRDAYVVLGVTVEGHKDILSITVGGNKTSKFWPGILNDLKNFPPILKLYIMRQMKQQPFRNLKISKKHGERNTRMQSATGKTTGRMSVLSFSFQEISGGSCIPPTS